MSKKISVDFSAYDELEIPDGHWTPPSQDYFGSHGYNEVRTATANYLSIGDVGDPDWREARRLPFGDEALEAFYPGSRGISFIQYPWEHPDADDVDENPVTRMISSDPTLEWALKQMETLEENSDRYNQLADLVSEIRGYATSQIEEEAFIHAPSWAMDSLIYAQERSNDPEITKIVEEFGPRKSMRGKVISTAMYPDSRAIKSIGQIYDEYDLKLPEGSREYCFALKEGKKVFGPYGPKYSNIKFYKDPNSNFAGSSAFRKEQMYKVLHDVGIMPIFDQDDRLELINHSTITPDNLVEAKSNYSRLALIINEANSITSFIVQHINGIQEDIYWEKLKSYLKKTHAYNDVISWSADLNPERSPASCLRMIGHLGLAELIEDYETIQSKVYNQINTNYYVLNVGKNTQIGITNNKEDAEYFKTGNADDLLYFLLDKKSQEKLGRLSEVSNTYGYNSKEYVVWRDKALKTLLATRYSSESLQKLVSLYNTSRRSKTVSSRLSREYGWILGELPFSRQEIITLSDCLEAYGRAIVAGQQKVPVIRQVFGRLKSRLELDISEDKLPTYALQSIASNGKVNFVYTVKTKSVPTGELRKQLLSQGLLSQEEINSGKYLDIKLDYDYVFTNPSDVFRYVSNFAATPKAIMAAQSK